MAGLFSVCGRDFFWGCGTICGVGNLICLYAFACGCFRLFKKWQKRVCVQLSPVKRLNVLLKEFKYAAEWIQGMILRANFNT